MTPELLDYYEDLHNRKVLLFFSGPVSQGVVEGVAELMREKLRLEQAGAEVAQRVFAILIEQMQNIARHSAERFTPDSATIMAHGQVAVGREDDGRFYVACGNRIRNADSGGLARRMAEIQALSGPDLATRYRQARRELRPKNSLGAGLGLIDMARKAARPLDFRITALDRDTAFFAMKVVA